MAVYWDRAVPLVFYLCWVCLSSVLIVCVPFPFGVEGRMWNLILSVPDHCHCLFFNCLYSFSVWCLRQDVEFVRIGS